MKKFQYCIMIIACLVIFSCKTENNYTSKEVRKVFNQQEIKDLKILVDYFESKIKVDGKDMESCYKDWIMTLADEEINNDIQIFNYKELLELYKKIDSSTFNQIWLLGESFNRFGNKVYSKSNSPNLYGKYLEFLKEVGKERVNVAEHAEEILGMNDYDSILYLFFEFNEKEAWIVGDFADYNNKLIVTIHTLNYADMYYRKEKLIN